MARKNKVKAVIAHLEDKKIKERLKKYGARSDKVHRIISKSRPIKYSKKQGYRIAGHRIPIKRGKKSKQSTQGRSTGTVGRPKGTLKIRINPFTGKPIKIPAKQYYKLVKQYRQQSQAVSQNVDTQQVRQLARRGIPPEQARVIVNARQVRQAVPRQFQRPQVVHPQAYQAEYQRIQRMEPWARRSAMQQLQRKMEVDRRLQNEGRTRLPTPHQPQRMEVNLMTGRPSPNQNSFQRREKWTT